MVNNAAGTGAGTINDTGENSLLYFDSTFNNATINLGNTSGGFSFLEKFDSSGAGTVLTLGSGVTIDESGNAEIGMGNVFGDGIVNQGNIKQSGTSSILQIQGNSLTNSGTITAASSGGILTIDTTTFTNDGSINISNGKLITIEPATFTNDGAIDISNGETATIDPTTSFTNLSGTTLTGGAYSVDAGSVLELADNAKITTDDANITLSGTGSTIQSENTTTSAQQSFDGTLRTIGKTGQLHLLADCSLTTAAAAIADNGLMQLGGGTLNVTRTGSSLTIGAAGKLSGFGVVDAAGGAKAGAPTTASILRRACDGVRQSCCDVRPSRRVTQLVATGAPPPIDVLRT